MENNYYVPAQIIENNLKGAVGKANLKLYKMIMMGFFAGMFIAIKPCGAYGGQFRTCEDSCRMYIPCRTHDVIDYRCRAVYRKLYDDNSGY